VRFPARQLDFVEGWVEGRVGADLI